MDPTPAWGGAFTPVPAADISAGEVVRSGLGAGYGRLADIASWLARVRPRGYHSLERVVIVVVAVDHGIAAADVDPPGPATAELLGALRAGSGPVAALAARAGARVRIEEPAADQPVPRPRVDRADAMSAEQTRAAIAVGATIADQEADGGVELLLLGSIGAGSAIPVAALAGLLTGSEPVAVVGRDGVDTGVWMRRTAAVRDAMHRGAPFRDDPVALLQHIGGADLACCAGLLAQAAVRRTPVLIDGDLAAVAGLLAAQLAPGAPAWWAAGSTSRQPPQQLALGALGIEPMLDLGLPSADGTGALIALDVIRATLALTRPTPA